LVVHVLVGTNPPLEFAGVPSETVKLIQEVLVRVRRVGERLVGATARNSKISACDDGGGQGGTGMFDGGLRIIGIRDWDVVDVVEAREALFREFMV
jgi:hypothetical protein